MKIKYLAMVSLLLVSFNAFAYCSWDDHDCNAQEAESRKAEQSYLADQEQMRNDMRYEREQMRRDLESERDYQERERLHFEQDTDGADTVIRGYWDNDG